MTHNVSGRSLSSALTFRTNAIVRNITLFSRQNGPFFSITFSNNGAARCIALYHNAPSPVNGGAVLDGNVVGARGVMPNIQNSLGGLSFVTKYEGLVYGDTYDVYCAQNSLLSPKYTCWHGSIVSPTQVQQVSRNSIMLRTTFAGDGFVR